MNPIYTHIFRGKGLFSECRSVADMARALRAAADELDHMAAAGIQLDPGPEVEDDFLLLWTEDVAVARRFGLELEAVEPDDIEEGETEERLS